jgi:hypothetical protein
MSTAFPIFYFLYVFLFQNSRERSTTPNDFSSNLKTTIQNHRRSSDSSCISPSILPEIQEQDLNNGFQSVFGSNEESLDLLNSSSAQSTPTKMVPRIINVFPLKKLFPKPNQDNQIPIIDFIQASSESLLIYGMKNHK